MDDLEIQKQKANVASLSIISNSVLVVLKAAIGILIGSVSVLSEAIHSGMDLVATIIAFVPLEYLAKKLMRGIHSGMPRWKTFPLLPKHY